MVDVHVTKSDISFISARMRGIMVVKEVMAMTIEKRIKDELKRLSDQNPALYSTAHNLEERFQSLTDQVRDYLSKINSEMPEYDKHDASHSEAVLDIIEQLLQEKGIEKLSLLEAIMLRFCCYFHDCGMILPSYCTPLLEKVEADPNADPAEGLEEWLAAEGRTFVQVKDLFLIPGSRDGYLDLLLGELEAYQAYWQGLPPAPESMKRGDYIKTKRHDHLRGTHSERTKTYAANLSRFFGEIIQGGEMDLANAIGDICGAHGWEYQQVRKLPVSLELFRNCPEMRCNVRYLAMLLRMGDLLHFGPDRASGVLYYEQEQVGPESDLHWRAKMNTRGYRIDPTADGGVDITYHGSFTEPREYYFILEHMDRVDEELICYESFRREMEKQLKENLYDLGLPEKVDRNHIAHPGFEPDQDLKFKLEHQNIIRLLMGARLYRDEFMCLRELYQNALDACRCMRAEQQTRYGAAGELEIEFGLGRDDDGGDYLYCKDQGTGMTMDIVKNYLLRIGNSYYKSDEFRRRNAQWNNAVAPVSEFGIGLLSCYMIADRIDVITRHYSAPEGEGPIWISMKDTDGFGYCKNTNLRQRRQLGSHGTIVKLYLLDKFKDKVTGYIPEEPRDAVFMLDGSSSHVFGAPYLDDIELLEPFRNSLYHQVQKFVHIPTEGIPVWIRGEDRREKLFCADEFYDTAARYPTLTAQGFHLELDSRWGSSLDYQDREAYQQALLDNAGNFATYICRASDVDLGASASVILRLPTTVMKQSLMQGLGYLANAVSHFADDRDFNGGENRRSGVYIDGMPFRTDEIPHVIRINYCGRIRPRPTVDRGEIQEFPKEALDVLELLADRLLDEIVRRIREHVRHYPQLRTPEFSEWLYWLFTTRFLWTEMRLLREFSTDLLRDYRLLGVTLYDWFHSETLTVDGNMFSRYGWARTLTYNACAHAKSVRLEEGRIVLERVLDENMLKVNESDVWLTRADAMPEKYSQYDSVSQYPGLLPERTFRLLSESFVITGATAKNQFGLLGAIVNHWDAHSLRYPEKEDVLIFLREAPDHRKLHSSYRPPFVENGNKRYMLYIFVAPGELTLKEEEELQLWHHIPEYIRGVREGWSILFYNYQNGYVIAPGIVDRMEMLKLLPDEARNHDDGLEYYFTDGTPAF